MAAGKRHRQRWQDQHSSSSSSSCCKRPRVVIGAAVVAAVLLALLQPAAAQPLPAARASMKAARSTWTAAVAQTQAAAALTSPPALPPPMPVDGKVGLDEAAIVREMSSIVHDDMEAALEWFEYPPLHDSSGNTNLMHGVARLYGPGIIQNQTQTTRGLIKAARQAFAPLRVQLSTHYVLQQRTVGRKVQNFPKAAQFEALDIFFAMTVARNVTLATPITVDLLQLGNSYITRQLKKANLVTGNLLLGLSFPADVPSSALVAPNAQFESILRVTGPGLPFEVEKQTALLGVLQSLTDGTSNIAALNITAPDGEPATAFPTARKLLAGGADVFYIGLGMLLQPGSTSPEQFCNELFTGLLGNGLYKKTLAAAGLPLDLQWINTTAMVSYAEDGSTAYDTSVYAAPPDNDDESILIDEDSNDDELSPIAIGGISAAALAFALAVALASLVMWRRRRRRRQQDAAAKLPISKRAARETSPPSRGDSAQPDQSSTQSSPRAAIAPVALPAGLALKRALGSIDVRLIDPGEISICKREDGSDWLLGAGSFGKAYKGLWSGGKVVAVKQLRPASGDTLWFSSLAREISIMSSISSGSNIVQVRHRACLLHERVTQVCNGYPRTPTPIPVHFHGYVTLLPLIPVQYYGACLAGEDVAMLVMEHCSGGDLRKAWLSSEGLYGWAARGRDIALDIARGLQFLHSKGIIHRDLKTSNILLTADGTAKVSDVGLSTVMTAAEPGAWDRTAGSFNYASPELLLGVRGVTYSTDVFSFGILLWEICTQEMPIRGQLRDIQVPQEAPAEVAQLINECLQPNPALRPTAAQLYDRIQAIPRSPVPEVRQPAWGPLAREMLGQDNGQRGAPSAQGMASLRTIYADMSRSLQAGRRRTVSACDCPDCREPPDDARSVCSCPDCRLDLEAAPAADSACAGCQPAVTADRQQQQQQQQQQHWQPQPALRPFSVQQPAPRPWALPR